MYQQSATSSKNLYTIGLNYKKADAEIRGRFSISESSKKIILKEAREEGIPSLLLISTCNRTEITGFAEHPFQLIKLLCAHTQGTVEDFEKVAYIFKNNQAIDHLFRVGTGLDSQILGDFEIISQLKLGFKLSKSMKMANPFMERLVNSIIQASKRIKNETEISSGATSVSFASVHYILRNIPDISEKNILLFGTGKIGRNTCENLIKHTRNDHIVLINRTKEKAERIAGKFNLIVKDYASIQSEISKADVLIVATGAQHPTISKEILYLKKPLLILDLSIPKNVADNVKDLPEVSLIHLDDLSRITDKTLAERKKHIPKAQQIISEVRSDFDMWHKTRKFAPTIKALKQKLHSLKEAEINNQKKKQQNFNEEQAAILSDRIIHKITTQFANYLKDEENATDESVAWIEKVFQIENKAH